MKNDKTLISIIVRTKNEEDWIGKCISAINKQSVSDFEIIVVDSGSTDNTVKIAKSYESVKIIEIDKYLPGYALNQGIKNSKGEFIVMLSAHCIPCDNNWLKTLIADLSNDNVAGVYGKQLPVAFSDPRDVRDLYITFGDDKRVQKKDSFFHNANSSIKRSTWESYPFKDHVTNIEDRIWGKEVTESGLNIIYEPKASVFHYHGIHQSNNVERVKNTINIIKSIDKNNKLNQLPDELLPENCNIISLIPIKRNLKKLGNYDPIQLLIESIKESKYISNNYFLSNESILKNIKLDFQHTILGRPNNKNYSLGDLLKWGLDKINQNSIYPDYVVYLNPEYIFRSKGYLDMIINEITTKGLDSVFTGLRDFSDYWFHSKDKKQYSPVNTELISREEKFPLYKSLFGLGTVVKSRLIKNKTFVSEENVEIIYTDNIQHSLRANNKNTEKLLEMINERR
tara:strand:+ start:6214 stop:7575 length:1362 start_codon:yes stop_codon:yes gene_type:complete